VVASNFGGELRMEHISFRKRGWEFPAGECGINISQIGDELMGSGKRWHFASNGLRCVGCRHEAAVQRERYYDTCRRLARSHATSARPSIDSKSRPNLSVLIATPPLHR